MSCLASLCWQHWLQLSLFFFFNDTATTEIYTLSLHDALPISAFLSMGVGPEMGLSFLLPRIVGLASATDMLLSRSEEHTSELQSQSNLVCRLLLEKKKIHELTFILTHGLRIVITAAFEVSSFI